MELLVDRFAVSDARRVIDLATGDPIVLTITSAGGSHDQTRWALRCDTLLKLRHHAMVPLVDYGPIGETQRFEAWRCGSLWTGSQAAADIAASRVTAFLHGCGLTAGGVRPANVRQSVDGPRVLIDATAGYPIDPMDPMDNEPTQMPRAARSIEDCGILVQPRPAVATIGELFAAVGNMRPQIAALWGSRGAGKSTAISELARLARLQGFVPGAVQVVARPEFREVLAERTLFLIADDTLVGWRALMGAMATPKAHVLVFAGTEEVPGVHGIALDRLAVSTLVSSVQPPS